MRIDPGRSVAALDAMIAAAERPDDRAKLENYREHLVAEVTGDLERIMATMVDEPVYHSWSEGRLRSSHTGQAATRAFYQRMFDAGMNVLERTFERIMIGEGYLLSDGRIHHVFPGAVLHQRGLDVDPGAHYLSSYRILAWLPYELRDGRAYMAGEDTYTEGPPTPATIVRLEPWELPGPVTGV